MRIQVRNIEKPDETRAFVAKGHFDFVMLHGHAVGRGVFEPGWRWSKHVKPLMGTESCQAEHRGYVLRGRMRIVMNEGESAELGPGDFFEIPKGHDAWVVG